MVGAAVLLACTSCQSGSSAPSAAPTPKPARPSAPSDVLAGIRATVADKRQAFDETVTLTPGLAKVLDASSPTLSGSGEVDYATKRAEWTLTLPAMFRGNLKVISIGPTTYVSVPMLGSDWISLTSAKDYSDFDSIPLLRDLVVLTNPLRQIDLLSSEHQLPATSASGSGTTRLLSAKSTPTPKVTPKPTPAPTSTPSPAPTAYPTPSPSPGSIGCSSFEIAHPQIPDFANGIIPALENEFADQFGIGTTANRDGIKRWRKNSISADGNEDGICIIRIAVEDLNTNGFNVVLSITIPDLPPGLHINAPALDGAFSFSLVEHITFPNCGNGTWKASVLSAPAFFPVGQEGTITWGPWTATGTAYLKLTTGEESGAATQASFGIDAVSVTRKQR